MLVLLVPLSSGCAGAQEPMPVACAGNGGALPAVDSTQLMRDIATLADDSMEGRGAGTDGGARARLYLLARYAQLGLDSLGSGRVQSFAMPGGKLEGSNIIGIIRGGRRPGQVIVVSAHYDHLGTRNGQVYNGADDNASGVSAMLAAATWFTAHRPDQTLLFVAFDGEEEGDLGSGAFVHAGLIPPDSILMNINLDMVSRSERKRLFAVGAARFPALLPYLEATACGAPVMLVLGHDKGWVASEDWTTQSDQFAFLGIGVPFIYFGVEDHPDYHKPTDDVSRIDPAFFLGATRTVARFVALVDASPAAAASAHAVATTAP